MPLFKTTNELKEHYPARVTFDFDDLLPTIKSVEEEYILEQVLGEAQYTELQSAYDAETLSAAQTALLEKLRPAIANLAVYHFTGFGNVEFSTGGLVTGQSEHKRPASEWRTRDLERAALRMGFKALDTVLGWLQARAADYPTWNDSEQAAKYRAGFIRSAAQFQDVVFIGNSGYLFLRMLPTLRRIEEGAILDTLCNATYRDSLLTKMAAGTLNAGETAVVKLVRNALAHLTMAESVVELSLGADDRGIWTWNSLLGGGTSAGPTAATADRLNNRIENHRKLGNGFLDKLRSTLQAQAEADPTHPYRSSSCYVNPTDEQPNRFQTDSPVGGFMA